jgi:myo-inositol-1-phosphate synthase
MDETLEKMTKLANDLCDQLEKVEAENQSLKEQLQQSKTASAAATAPVVSADVAQATCDAMVNAGRITAEQVELVKKAFIEDPSAIHRAVVEILNAPAQEKTANVEEDLSGGTLVNGSTKEASSDIYASVYETLGLKF